MFIATQVIQLKKPRSEAIALRSIGIGIETGFLLRPLDPKIDTATIREFSRQVASGYLQYISHSPMEHPRMHNAIDEPYLGTRFAEWSLDTDSTFHFVIKHCFRGFLRTFLPFSALIQTLRGARMFA